MRRRMSYPSNQTQEKKKKKRKEKKRNDHIPQTKLKGEPYLKGQQYF